jgi:HD-GYP domain-containing protein (c-di-GMP phosphodiesterase class II)
MAELNKKISILDLIECLSIAMDLISPAMTNHQRRVGYIAQKLAEETDIEPVTLNNVLVAGFLHDCGALSLDERNLAVDFELNAPSAHLHRHAEAGYHLLRKFPPFHKVAQFVRFHHLPWNYGAGKTFGGQAVPLCSHILHLADRIDVLIDKDRHVLCQQKEITQKIMASSGTLFAPQLVDAFRSLAEKEYFWLDIKEIGSGSLWGGYSGFGHITGDYDTLLGMTSIFSHIIDFRSRFTATHSSGVSACAVTLARLCGMSEDDCFMMQIAGNLHDLGKLAVPTELLEKQGKLSEEEFCVIRSHTYYTYKTLKKFREFDMISRWAAHHHERLDGRGYPFHLTEEVLSLGCRIMAVADVFTAITEERPYRPGMDDAQAIRVLRSMVADRALDHDIVQILLDHFNEFSQVRSLVQQEALSEYREFERHLATF